MKFTPNYGLYTESDSTTKFSDWRESLVGEADSNMVKIDSVLSEKADKSVSFDATLSATGWIGIDAPYTQEVLIDGLLADQNGLFSLAQSATAE